MAEELSSLLDRIQKDGVAKAEAQAADIIARAEKKAARLMVSAEAEAQAKLTAAETDAAVFAQRADTSIQQAARDVVLSVHQAVTETIRGLVKRRVGTALDTDALVALITKMAEGYAAGGTEIEVLLSEKDLKAIGDMAVSALKEATKAGVDVRSDESIVGGFRIGMKGRNVEHDFTQEAITDALCRLLRPQLAEMLKQATQEAPA